MIRSLALALILAAAAAGLWAQEAGIEYLVVPSEKSVPVVAAFDPARPQYFPMLNTNQAKQILFYVEPMNKRIKSYGPKKDPMGLEYIPVYVDEAGKKLLWYVNPMDPSIRSDKPMQDHMGMDYLPVYQMRLYVK